MGAPGAELGREAGSSSEEGSAGPGGQRVESAQLLARFLMGAMLLGGDELVGRLRQAQQQIEADSQRFERELDLGSEKTPDLLRHLAVGLLARGRKRLAAGLHDGFYFSLGAADWLAEKADAWTDNRLARPFRRPVEAQWERLVRGVSLIIHEGRLEEQNDRVLVSQALEEVVDGVLEYASHDPEMARLITEQLEAQSSGLADVVATSARHVTVAGDDALEGLVRRLLRRKPRRDLPPSPLFGKAQDMYREKTHK